MGKLLGGILKVWGKVNATPLTGPAPTWWTALVAAASVFAVTQWGAPLCP